MRRGEGDTAVTGGDERPRCDARLLVDRITVGREYAQCGPTSHDARLDESRKCAHGARGDRRQYAGRCVRARGLLLRIAGEHGAGIRLPQGLDGEPEPRGHAFERDDLPALRANRRRQSELRRERGIAQPCGEHDARGIDRSRRGRQPEPFAMFHHGTHSTVAKDAATTCDKSDVQRAQKSATDRRVHPPRSRTRRRPRDRSRAAGRAARHGPSFRCHLRQPQRVPQARSVSRAPVATGKGERPRAGRTRRRCRFLRADALQARASAAPTRRSTRHKRENRHLCPAPRSGRSCRAPRAARGHLRRASPPAANDRRARSRVWRRPARHPTTATS